MLPPTVPDTAGLSAVAIFDDTFGYHFFMSHSPAPDDLNCQFLINTVADNLKLFTKREQADAKLARIAFHGTGRQEIPTLKAFLCGGYIRNCPVLAEDVDRAVESLART